MNLPRQFHLILYILSLVVLFPVSLEAVSLDAGLLAIANDFEREIDDIADGKIVSIAVCSFLDGTTRKPTALSEAAEEAMLKILFDKHLGKKKTVILNWKRNGPLEKAPGSDSDPVQYRFGRWEKDVFRSNRIGFVITGTTTMTDGLTTISAELIGMERGIVLKRSSETLHSSGDVALSYKKYPKPVESISPEKILEETAPKGTLFVETDPDNADVDVITGGGDRFYQGISLEPGTHRIRISAVGYENQTKMVLIDPGMASKISVQLEPVDEPKKDVPTILIGENFRYEGEAVNGKKDGQGTIVLANGDRYTGQWKDDIKHGRGVYFFASGDKYDGEWENGKFHGTGTYTFANGSRYVGQWRYDQKHGEGIYHHKSGDRWEGSYVNNKRHGKGIFFGVTGEPLEEYWENGRLIR